MGAAEDSRAEADDLNGGTQKDRCSAEGTVGEGEALRLASAQGAYLRFISPQPINNPVSKVVD